MKNDTYDNDGNNGNTDTVSDSSREGMVLSSVLAACMHVCPDPPQTMRYVYFSLDCGKQI